MNHPFTVQFTTRVSHPGGTSQFATAHGPNVSLACAHPDRLDVSCGTAASTSASKTTLLEGTRINLRRAREGLLFELGPSLVIPSVRLRASMARKANMPGRRGRNPHRSKTRIRWAGQKTALNPHQATAGFRTPTDPRSRLQSCPPYPLRYQTFRE